MIRVREGTDPLLRRPFSFSRIYPEEGDIEILYRVVGRGTWLMSRLAPGSTASIIGPLGNGFELPLDRTVPLAFIAGGIGIAPLLELIAQVHPSAGKRARAICIFSTARARPPSFCPKTFLKTWAYEVHFATDDGSFGYKGSSPECLKNSRGRRL